MPTNSAIRAQGTLRTCSRLIRRCVRSCGLQSATPPALQAFAIAVRIASAPDSANRGASGHGSDDADALLRSSRRAPGGARPTALDGSSSSRLEGARACTTRRSRRPVCGRCSRHERPTSRARAARADAWPGWPEDGLHVGRAWRVDLLQLLARQLDRAIADERRRRARPAGRAARAARRRRVVDVDSPVRNRTPVWVARLRSSTERAMIRP